MSLLQGMSHPSPLIIYHTIADSLHRQVRTRDMGGNSTTNEFTRAVLDKM